MRPSVLIDDAAQGRPSGARNRIGSSGSLRRGDKTLEALLPRCKAEDAVVVGRPEIALVVHEQCEAAVLRKPGFLGDPSESCAVLAKETFRRGDPEASGAIRVPRTGSCFREDPPRPCSG